MKRNNSPISADRSKQRYFVVIILMSLGLVLSIYLYSIHLSSRLGASIGGICAVLGGGCEEALRSPLSEVLGIPLAFWGIVFYVVLGLQLSFHRMASGKDSPRSNGISVLLASIAALGGLILLSLMAVGTTPFCPLCMLVHFLNLCILLLLYLLTMHSGIEILRRGWLNIVEFIRGSDPLDTARRLSITGNIATLLGGTALCLWAIIIEKDLDVQNQAVDEKLLVVAMQNEQQRNIPIHADDPILGDTSALIKVIVFSDFQCTSCGMLAREFMKLAPMFGEDAALIFKNLPLDSDCNTMLKNSLHPRACEAARAAEAARMQGRFWQFHDDLFLAGVPRTDAELVRIAVGAGCDSSRFLSDFYSEESAAAVQRDTDLARDLRLDGTPSVFINGRQLRDIRPAAVHAVLELALLDLRRFRQMFTPVDKNAVKGDTVSVPTPGG